MTVSRGWCPTLSTPMSSGDGLLLRIRPALSRLDATVARRLAAAAAWHGNGVIELTTRGNLQVRGFSDVSAAAFADEMEEAGLSWRRHAPMVSPLADGDPACAPETLGLAVAVEAALADDPALDGLAPKFAVLVDGGGQMPMASVAADIALRAAGQDWRIEAGGAATLCGADAASEMVRRLARAALALGIRPQGAPGCGEALFQAAGWPARAFEPMPAPPPVAVGRLPARAFGIGLPPGQLNAALLTRLAELAEGLGDGTLRLTPWRALLLAGLSDQAEPALRRALAGQLTDPDDPRLRVASCIGGPGCASGSVPAAADARLLAAVLPAMPPGGLALHVSGCAKGCAHPEPAAVTLVGRDGLYDLVEHGRASDTPVRRGLMVEAAAALLRAAARSEARA